MAYEDYTYENILNRMIETATMLNPNIDTREGSILFNALAPAALELAIKYTELNNILAESFVNTASREYILRACDQMGMDISVFNAHAGEHKAQFNVQVNIGSRWNCGLYNYTVMEYLGLENEYHTYRLLCETTGSAPNNQTGDLTPITEIPEGLTYYKLTECIVEGEDETEDDVIRAAYYEYVNNTYGDGNTDQYKKWCNEYEGIGNSKVFRLWNGANTVKVSILSASNGVASDELVNEFQEYLDPSVTGMGDGVAPIGAFVTVSTATEKAINITAKVKLRSGYTDTTLIDKAVSKYLEEISYVKGVVPYMNIGAVILATECVDSITELKIDGGTIDIPLGEEEIPTLGTTNWTVI